MKKLILLIIITGFGCSGGATGQRKGPLPKTIPKQIQITQKSDQKVIARLKQLQTLPRNTYRIGGGDQFDIFIYGEEDLTTINGVVKQDGTISMKLIGEVSLQGKTLTEAQKIIEQRYKKYLKHPSISIIPRILKSARISVLGKVNKPGIHPIEGRMKVLDAIATAGGFTTGLFQNSTVEMADLEHAYLIRQNELLPVNFSALVRKRNMLHNIPLKDGDYIYIPSAMNQEVYVIGEVKSPGFFGYKENMTLLQLLSKARGLKDTASTQGIIVRGGMLHPTVYHFNLEKMVNGLQGDFKIEPDDILFVPKSYLGSWHSIISQLLPGLQAIQTGFVLYNVTK